MKPQQAWNLAQKEKRTVLRPVPRCPWWPFVWSLRTPIKVGPDGRVATYGGIWRCWGAFAGLKAHEMRPS